ncbi:16S rRNA (guanine(966)-N(2))-methyltransferase RsmD [Olivibacter sitiensis]|uniref:16S rRNA (guanine(966)-N(2))-methyltransferase RsmD n=1 Tax=Olivibacter sitiensis TaxID=376470 RepID=UPI0004163FD3|nr:16S rRNA (guanine(966)-N(2))-methyltransferase RsmD [Olivibacter sitiensis]
MRIIGGKYRGLVLHVPKGLPVRPTTDLAKESLFNILNNRMEIEGCSALDLFSGTGNIMMELASRGAGAICAVDKSGKCCAHLKNLVSKFDLKNIQIVKDDVFKFLQRGHAQYDLIFADPPYDLPQLTQLPQLIFDKELLSPNGIFILEHPTMKKVDHHPHFKEQRKYGYSSFSFFERQN